MYYFDDTRTTGAFRTRGRALSVSHGVDRDHAVDESGNQLSVFGRRGSRPFNREEMERLFLRNGELFALSDSPPGTPSAPGNKALSNTPVPPSSLAANDK